MVSAVATVNPSKPLESFLLGFSCSGEGGVRDVLHTPLSTFIAISPGCAY